MEEKIYCIYHSRDLDGWTSAAIVKRRFPQATLIGWDYGDEFPNIEKGIRVIMVDIAFPMHIMEDVAKNSGWQFIWIDHHKSAIKEFKDFTKKALCSTCLDENFAACELTWEYFFHNEKIPEAIRLLGRYDCFGHKGTHEEKIVLAFQYFARSCVENPNQAYRFINMPNEDIKEGIRSGKDILSYLEMEARQAYRNIFVLTMFGKKFAIINKERFNPVNFGINYHNDGFDGFICFWYKNGKWNWSLYNDNEQVDVSEIAKQFGGGGHKGAAGMVTDKLLWENVDALGLLSKNLFLKTT